MTEDERIEIDLNDYGYTDSAGDDVSFAQLASFYEGFLRLMRGWVTKDYLSNQAWVGALGLYATIFDNEDEDDEE